MLDRLNNADEYPQFTRTGRMSQPTRPVGPDIRPDHGTADIHPP